jgi:hypothetical protein
MEKIQSCRQVSQPHHPASPGLIVMVHFQLPDRGLKDSYEDAPSKNHSGENVATLPSGHMSDSGRYPNREEQEANNDPQRCQAIQVLLPHEAQLSSL